MSKRRSEIIERTSRGHKTSSVYSGVLCESFGYMYCYKHISEISTTAICILITETNDSNSFNTSEIGDTSGIKRRSSKYYVI